MADTKHTPLLQPHLLRTASSLSRSLADLHLDRLRPALRTGHSRFPAHPLLEEFGSRRADEAARGARSKVSHIFSIQALQLQPKLVRGLAPSGSRLGTEPTRRGLVLRAQPAPSRSLVLGSPQGRSALDRTQQRLSEYRQWARARCLEQGLSWRQVESYGRRGPSFFVGKGNNQALVRQAMQRRWWWVASEGREGVSLLWTQLRDANFSSSQQSLHNHFQGNGQLGHKKNLLNNMRVLYQAQGRDVFQSLPLTFIVRQIHDSAWQQFKTAFEEDRQKHPGQRRLWILKPGENSNRGRGISLHSQVGSVQEAVAEGGRGEDSSERTFVVQKYIDSPLLYQGRKFDIRCYVLLVRLEGYIRTSGVPFALQAEQDPMVHLTNDAVQVHSQHYGRFEEGNKLSFASFQKFLDQEHGGRRLTEEICPRLRDLARDAIEAAAPQLGRESAFEVFGLDFMLDWQFQPWLIEVNTNPCLQTGCGVLRRLIPRMLQHSLQLSVDLLFPGPRVWPSSRRHLVPGWPCSNLFELVFESG